MISPSTDLYLTTHNTHNRHTSTGLLWTSDHTVPETSTWQHSQQTSIGLLWTSDHTVPETSTWKHTTVTTDIHRTPLDEWSARRTDLYLTTHNNHYTHPFLNAPFIFSNSSPKIVPFLRLCRKIWYRKTDHRWQYNTAHALCILVTKATNTHSEHVIFIPFPLQQWLWESTSLLRYVYSAWLVIT